MDAPESPELPTRALPTPTEHTIACEVCNADVHYLRVTTPEGMPDFIHSLDDYAWIGWSLTAAGDAVSLVATCSRGCLGEWWLNQTAPGA